MTQRLTPYEICTRLIGPPERISETCGFGPKSAYAWRFGTSTRDAGDLPSARTMRRLLAHSTANGLGLTENHLIWGADAAEIDAILAARPDVPSVAAE